VAHRGTWKGYIRSGGHPGKGERISEMINIGGLFETHVFFFKARTPVSIFEVQQYGTPIGSCEFSGVSVKEAIIAE